VSSRQPLLQYFHFKVTLELSPREWHNLEDLINLLGPLQKYPSLSCLAATLSDFLMTSQVNHLP